MGIDVEAGYGYVHDTALTYNNQMGLSSERGKIKYIFIDNHNTELSKLVPTPDFVYKRIEEEKIKLRLKAEKERKREEELEKERQRKEEAEKEMEIEEGKEGAIEG